MRWFLLLSLAYAADTVDLAESNYAMRLAPKFLRGEKPGHPKVPCTLTKSMADSLSRAQDKLRITELYMRVNECGPDYVDLALEDRAGLKPKKAGETLDAALQGEGWKKDPAKPGRYLP